MSVENNKYKIEQDFKFEGDDWWSWWVWIEGESADLDNISYVIFTLHSTFRNPVRKIDDRNSKFTLKTEGWGTFPIYAKLVLKDNKEIALTHELYLDYPDGSSNVE